ncbi:NUDIX hydrolase domain-like protein [Kickxella alabastrina]|uniref:NUDIX hydrolase domain-like protein n=1 Tax=Kickxella alabastrina TaxID=61397 RepID=UPI002220557E|nr:NUDIX hydrolase domain-like protein [Kickxella alabastrina]KAI7828354.1 NUDIX hydrolase domain-like protein [Kickxella alabastrina]
MDSARINYFTVIFPFSPDGNQVLLGLKKRGMGQGLWNGFGGKPESGETMDQCAHRELQEECGLVAEKLRYVGVLYMDDMKGPSHHILVYTLSQYSGNISESDEMKPKWFDTTSDSLPYDQMHIEASYGLFVARFLFNGENIAGHAIERVSSEQLLEHKMLIENISATTSK